MSKSNGANVKAYISARRNKRAQDLRKLTGNATTETKDETNAGCKKIFSNGETLPHKGAMYKIASTQESTLTLILSESAKEHTLAKGDRVTWKRCVFEVIYVDFTGMRTAVISYRDLTLKGKALAKAAGYKDETPQAQPVAGNNQAAQSREAFSDIMAHINAQLKQ